eukprot:GFUD01017030.1.p1 GENE.GFUD01017030.1~~GFUD01017030.1.p1  ORF type:complete len:210 (-),score=45.05 GFUD01017030.1:162-791(-)
MFYTCREGQATEELCQDGLVFNLEVLKCVLPQYDTCKDRPVLQPSQGIGPCDRKNGVFYDDITCDQFVTCQDNQPVHSQCAPGLVFDPEEKLCAWADEVLRPGCLPSELLDFTCPNPILSKEVASQTQTDLRFGDHDRLADPRDCRYFFTCLTTGHPRRAGCGGGMVFNSETGTCSQPEEVAGCEDYYKGVTSEKEILNMVAGIRGKFF